jgi:hypothetical protein
MGGFQQQPQQGMGGFQQQPQQGMGGFQQQQVRHCSRFQYISSRCSDSFPCLCPFYLQGFGNAGGF